MASDFAALGDVAYSNFSVDGGVDGRPDTGPGWFRFNSTDGYDQFGLSFQAEAGGALTSVWSVLGYFRDTPITTADLSVWRSDSDGRPMELLSVVTAEVDVFNFTDQSALVEFEFDGSAELIEGAWYSVVLTNPNLGRSLTVDTAAEKTQAPLVVRAGPGDWTVKPAELTSTSPAMHIEVVPAPGAVGLCAALGLVAARRDRRRY